MLGLYSPTDGNVIYRDKNISMMTKEEVIRFRRKVQPIFQDADSTLDPRQSVAAILEEPLLIHHVGEKKMRKRLLSEVLDKVNLSASLLGRYPSELSGGQRQRVAIARALLLNPELIIADEPTSGLDPMVSAQILDLLLSLRKASGVAIVLISHDLNTVNFASDRIAVMYRGKIVEMIDGEHFEKDAQHPYTRFLKGIEPGVPETSASQGVHQLSHAQDIGCSYAHLCPYRTTYCYEASPELKQLTPWLHVACHVSRTCIGSVTSG